MLFDTKAQFALIKRRREDPTFGDYILYKATANS